MNWRPFSKVAFGLFFLTMGLARKRSIRRKSCRKGKKSWYKKALMKLNTLFHYRQIKDWSKMISKSISNRTWIDNWYAFILLIYGLENIFVKFDPSKMKPFILLWNIFQRTFVCSTNTETKDKTMPDFKGPLSVWMWNFFRLLLFQQKGTQFFNALGNI